MFILLGFLANIVSGANCSSHGCRMSHHRDWLVCAGTRTCSHGCSQEWEEDSIMLRRLPSAEISEELTDGGTAVTCSHLLYQKGPKFFCNISKRTVFQFVRNPNRLVDADDGWLLEQRYDVSVARAWRGCFNSQCFSRMSSVCLIGFATRMEGGQF